MKRLLAISVLALGLLPSIPLSIAEAGIGTQEDLTRHCRDRLGFPQTLPLYGQDLLQLRHCIDSTREQFQYADRLTRRAGIFPDVDRYEEVQEAVTTRKETRRSLNDRLYTEGNQRITYFKETPVDIREYALQQHRTSRRLAVHEQEQRIILEKKEKQLRWQRAVQVCRYYA